MKLYNNADKLNRQIKSISALRGLSYERIAELLNNQYGYKQTGQNINKKIRNGTMSIIEFTELANVLGYDVELLEK